MSSSGKGDDGDKKSSLVGSFSQQTKNIAIWGGNITLSLVIYYFFSSGDFSFLLTYAAFMRCYGFGLLNYKMWTSKSSKGVSLKTLELYVLVFVTRLASILRHQGYLPFDKTGDWFYHSVEIVSLIAVLIAVVGIFFGPFMSTYQETFDRFGNLFVPSVAGVVYLVIPCILLAIFIHPNLNRQWFADMCWALSMYLESCAMLPQIYMFQKQALTEGGAVEVLVGHTVFALGFSRIFELSFWIGSFHELVDNGGSRIPGYFILLSQILHLVSMGDFFYYYVVSLRKGVPMTLPTTIPVNDNV